MAVYFIQAGEGGPVKIGFATNVQLRLNKISSDNHEPVRLVASYVGTQDDERRLHEMFAALRKHREWFHPAVLNELDRVHLAPSSETPARKRGYSERTPEQCKKISDGIRKKLEDPEYRARRSAAGKRGGAEWAKRQATLARKRAFQHAATQARMSAEQAAA